MNEALPLIAVASVIVGVLLSIAQGYGNRKDGEKFVVGKLVSSLIIGVMGSLSVSMLVVNNLQAQINELGIIALILIFISQGYGTDKGLTKLDS